MCALAIGCGGTSGDTSGGSTGGTTGGTTEGTMGWATDAPTGDGPHAWDAYPAMLCGALYDCGCAEGKLFGGTEAQCTTNFTEQFQIADGEGKVWDQACADRMLARIADQCAPGRDAVVQCALDHCALFQGSLPEGEICNDFDTYWGVIYSDCATGLRCANGSCIPACGPGEGESCPEDVAWSCADGFECAGGTCEARGGLGDPCICNESLDCVNDVCSVPPPEGSACTMFYDCASASCVDGVCGPMPAAGDPCSADGTCPYDMLCDENNTCRPYACQT